VNLSLFDDLRERQCLSLVVDALNRKHGEGAVTVGVPGERKVPLRIPFGMPDTA